jgi:hypothetical protein
MEDATSFCRHLIWGQRPSPQLLVHPQWPPPFSLTHRVGTCSPILASKGGKGGPKSCDSNKMRFSSLLLLHAFHAITHSVFLIWY